MSLVGDSLSTTYTSSGIVVPLLASYAGCYDRSMLTGISSSSGQSTQEACVTDCANMATANEPSFFAALGMDFIFPWCICLRPSQLQTYATVSQSMCDRPCQGNSLQYCGSQQTISVFYSDITPNTKPKCIQDGLPVTCTGIDFQTDTQNCGFAGNICPSPAQGRTDITTVCSAGSCGFTCNKAGLAYAPDTKCYNLFTDLNNCGAFGYSCGAIANGQSGCSEGFCSYACQVNYGLVQPSSPATLPTCADLGTDTSNCGGVGSKCPVVDGGAAACQSSTCVQTCTDMSKRPKKQVDGSYLCVDVVSSITDCGAINHICSPATNADAVCISAKCDTVCQSGFARRTALDTCIGITDVNNCGAVGNACPTTGLPLLSTADCVNQQCTFQCTAPATLNKSKTGCVDLTSDSQNCGTEGMQCTTPTNALSTSCVSGACAPKCVDGYTANADGTACFKLTTDVSNCGAVGNDCNANTQLPASADATLTTCVASVCTYVCTATSGLTISLDQKTCVNIQTDKNACGTNQRNCATSGPPDGFSPECLMGQCSYTCTNDLIYSPTANACVDLTTTATDCGTVGNACQAVTHGKAVCASSKCSATCESGYTLTKNAANLPICVDTKTDIAHCGGIASSNICQPPANAMAICASSACSFACNQGFTVSADGKSCVDLQTDANNCGTLSKVCPQPSTANSSPACAAGACTLKCNTGFGLSTRQGANICLDLLSDPANCGAVGQKCPLPVNGQASCNTGACYFLCTGGLTPTEDGQCVDTNTDVLHCGAKQVQCSVPTNGGKATCAAGACQEMCPSGTLLSTTSTAQGTTSTCVNIVTDAQNCGALAFICPPVTAVANSQPACKNRVCGFVCQTGFGLSLDGKTCLDLQNDKANCGAVSNVCPLGPGNEAAACVAGKCDWVCGTGLTKIDGVCYDIKSNNMHCGTDAATAMACTATAPRIPLCDAGVCSFTCITPYIKSADGLTCVNPLKDVNNCGKVNNVCGSIANADNTDITCVKGVCSYTCLPTYTLNAAATACVDLQVDNDNCGAVGSSCVPPPFATSAQCVAGKCDIVCPTGYELDSVTSTCVDIESDVNNCGALAMLCPVPDHSTATCSAGVCSFTCDASKGFVMSADKKSCVDTQNDYRNCGSLSNDCSTATPSLAIPQCISGKCTFMCQTGATATADGLACKDTQTDVVNCGALGKTCAKGPANSLATCSAGVCGFSCNEFYGVSTDKTRCVYLLTSFLNCGSVGNVCTPPTSGQSACNNGECEYVCQTGFGRTDKNACVDILTSIEACGTSNQRCTGPTNSLSTCDAGVCAWACAAGFSKSADGLSCIATSSDIVNCGALGQQCTLENSGYAGLAASGSNGSTSSNSTVGASAGATIVANPVCMNSTCSFGCVAPLVKSTTSKTCVDVSKDLNNCGALAAVCSAAVHNSIATCSSGKCGWTCPTGFVADDKTMTCADLMSDNQHCGSVGNVCQAPLNGTATCQGGKCGSACNTGFSLTSGGLCAPATMPSQSTSSGVSASSTMASVSSAPSASASAPASATSSAVSSASMSTEQSMSRSASASYSMSESAAPMPSSSMRSSASSAPPLVSVSASISASVGLSTPSDSASMSMTPSASSDSAPASSSASSSMQAPSSSEMPSMSASSTMSSSSPSPSASLVNVASYTSNGITYTYGGCMVDSAARILSDALSYSGSGGMTVEACLAAAASKGYMYAGVEYGSECYGSNTKPMAAALGDSACNMPCPGNSQQACGAGYALSLYIGSGVPTKPAASNLATFASSDVTWKYTSCWGEPGAGRALSNKILDGGATIEACLNAATQKGYTHAGLEYGGECWAASTVYGGQIPESYCDMACSANSAQMCGSGNVLSLYSASGVSTSAPSGSATTKTINGVAWKYQSCWGEPGEGRALDTPFDINANPTVEGCLAAGSGFRFCGLEYGGECYCSNTAPWGGAIPESYCSMACKGNASEKCGAGNVLSLWVKA